MSLNRSFTSFAQQTLPYPHWTGSSVTTAPNVTFTIFPLASRPSLIPYSNNWETYMELTRAESCWVQCILPVENLAKKQPSPYMWDAILQEHWYRYNVYDKRLIYYGATDDFRGAGLSLLGDYMFKQIRRNIIELQDAIKGKEEQKMYAGEGVIQNKFREFEEMLKEYEAGASIR